MHPYHHKIAPSISKIGRYIFLEILFRRRFFANGINFIRGSHKLTVTMSSNDVSSSSAFFYWFSSPYKILWKPFFGQTMRFSQHHSFPGLFSLQKGGIVTLHERSRTPDLSVAHWKLPFFCQRCWNLIFYYVLPTKNRPLVYFFTFSQIEV